MKTLPVIVSIGTKKKGSNKSATMLNADKNNKIDLMNRASRHPHRRNNCPVTIIAGAFATLLTPLAAADSAKLQWNGNGHYYQRFDEEDITWLAAETRCEDLNGYLATITSADEQGFRNDSLTSYSFLIE